MAVLNTLQDLQLEPVSLSTDQVTNALQAISLPRYLSHTMHKSGTGPRHSSEFLGFLIFEIDCAVL